jgi:hypothetical protein
MTRAQMLLAIAQENAQENAKALAIKHGIRAVDLPASAGETLEHTDAGFHRERPSVNDMPTAADALQALIDTVRAEDRRDSGLTLKQLGVDPATGELTWGNGAGSRPYLRRAYSQLCSLVSPRPECMSRYHLSVPPEQRHLCMAMDLERANDREVVARFRRPQGDERHHIFAFVSPSFRAWDPDACAEGLLEGLGDEADRYRASVNYWGTGARINLVAADEHNGSGAFAAASISTQDDGSAAIHIHSEVYMANGVRFPVSRSSSPVARVLHRGDPDTFSAQVRAGVDRALSHIEPWLDLWGDRNKAPLPMDMETVLGRLAGAEDIGRDPWMQVQGISAEELTRNLTETWMDLHISGAAEQTQAGLAYTVAAAAVRCTWSHEGATDALEHMAAALLAMTATGLEVQVTPQEATEAQETQGVDTANLDVARSINARRRLAQQWRLRAEMARQEGDAAGGRLADERAGLYEVEGDVVEETGLV